MKNGKKAHILIIDDDASFCEMLRIHISSAGYWAEVAEDAVEGGKALLASRPDLIVCDVKMPFLDGFELLSLLRGDEQTAAIPVILISGRSDSEAMIKALEAGAADYLAKPITRAVLLQSIETSLEKYGRRQK